MKRVFNIDIESCERCGGKVREIASIEDPAAIAHILKHLKQKEAGIQPHANYRRNVRHRKQNFSIRCFDAL